MCSPYFVYYGLVHSLKQIIIKYSAALTFEKNQQNTKPALYSTTQVLFIYRNFQLFDYFQGSFSHQ